MTPILGEIVGWELLLVLLLVVVLFGSAKLPQLARSMGQAAREFRKGTQEGLLDEPPADEAPADKAKREVDPPSRG